jgi:hypothetical protein
MTRVPAIVSVNHGAGETCQVLGESALAKALNVTLEEVIAREK